MEAAQAGQVDDEVSCRGASQAHSCEAQLDISNLLEEFRCQWQ